MEITIGIIVVLVAIFVFTVLAGKKKDGANQPIQPKNDTPPAEPEPPARAAGSSAKTVFLLGAIGLIAGSIMPWATFYSGLTGTLSIAGTQGDGIITLIGGCLFLLIGLTKKPTPGKSFSLIGGLFALGLLALVCAKIGQISGITAGNEYAITTVGSGLWITIIGSILSAVGGFMRS